MTTHALPAGAAVQPFDDFEALRAFATNIYAKSCDGWDMKPSVKFSRNDPYVTFDPTCGFVLQAAGIQVVDWFLGLEGKRMGYLPELYRKDEHASPTPALVIQVMPGDEEALLGLQTILKKMSVATAYENSTLLIADRTAEAINGLLGTAYHNGMQKNMDAARLPPQ